ncbi:hypothetical protein JOE44_004665 [Chryseobacterium sp. PvR013]|uniref:hypothetical protein n=1 Tax=Chryseobacterium sp. PvR013 TaxID=2806595 RepID=UPI001AE9B1CE|nr:hypothetical protein [Chryseobacterium sp. PvR013]MBP1167781.1 hypothetical protein [Chryseobacterium sp. PvR013]
MKLINVLIIKKIKITFPKSSAISSLLKQSELLSVFDVKHPKNKADRQTPITPKIKKRKHKIEQIFII